MITSLEKFESYLQNKNLKRKTISEYCYYFNRFFALYERFNQETVSRFLADKSTRNCVARGFLKNIQRYFIINYKELGLTVEDRLEISDVIIPEISGREKQRLVKPLTIEQIYGLEKHLSSEKEKLELMLSFYGGLRIGELLKIQVISFNWEAWKKDMTKYGECRVYGKGNKEGIAFFPPWLMKRVAAFIRSQKFKSLSSYLFLRDTESLEHINIENRKSSWQTKLKAAGIKAGIVKFDSEGKMIEETNVHPHKLRHSFGYYLKTVKRLDIRDIQELLRHSSIQSTQRYTFVDKGELKNRLMEKDFEIQAMPSQQVIADSRVECSQPQIEQTKTQQAEHKSGLTQ